MPTILNDPLPECEEAARVPIVGPVRPEGVILSAANDLWRLPGVPHVSPTLRDVGFPEVPKFPIFLSIAKNYSNRANHMKTRSI